MHLLGHYSNIPIQYIHIRTTENLAGILPEANWLAFVIADIPDKELLHRYAGLVIEKNVKWICCSGELYSYADDLFDWEYLARTPDFDEDNFVVTDFIEDIHKGFDWALMCAVNEGLAPVVCLDFGSYSQEKRLEQLLYMINSGSSPEE